MDFFLILKILVFGLPIKKGELTALFGDILNFFRLLFLLTKKIVFQFIFNGVLLVLPRVFDQSGINPILVAVKTG